MADTFCVAGMVQNGFFYDDVAVRVGDLQVLGLSDFCSAMVHNILRSVVR